MKQDEDVQIMTSNPDGFGKYFQNIWKYRALIWVFAKRDLKVKYSQTFIGLGWTLLQPLTSLIIFTFFFGFLLKWKTDGIDYPVYVLSGLLGWNYFSYVVNAGTFGLQESAHLIKKIYFPKSVIPLSKMLIALVELGVSLLLLIPLLLYFGQGLSWKIIFLPIVLLYNTACALCLVFWISVFAYKKRDLLHLIPFLLYFGIWFSPVFFSSDVLPSEYTFALDINPMANVIQAWRWSLFGYGEFNWYWLVNFFIVLMLLLTGIYVYNRKESELADYV
jgi:lipopolysaccharide transport system permease protein